MTAPTSAQLRKEWSVAHTCGPAAQGWKYCGYCALRAAIDLLDDSEKRILEIAADAARHIKELEGELADAEQLANHNIAEAHRVDIDNTALRARLAAAERVIAACRGAIANGESGKDGDGALAAYGALTTKESPQSTNPASTS